MHQRRQIRARTACTSEFVMYDHLWQFISIARRMDTLEIVHNAVQYIYMYTIYIYIYTHTRERMG